MSTGAQVIVVRPPVLPVCLPYPCVRRCICSIQSVQALHTILAHLDIVAVGRVPAVYCWQRY